MMLTQTFAANQVLFIVLASLTGVLMLRAIYCVIVFFKDERERHKKQQHYYNGDELNGWMDMFFPKSSDN